MTRRPSRHSRRRGSLLFRFSHTYTDIIILAQLLGALANIIWYWEISTSDLVGFFYVGGDIAGLLAYFGFMLFAALFFWRSPRRFWRSLHPVALGLALLMLSTHRLWSHSGLLIVAAALAGALIGRFIFRYALLYPRAALIALGGVIMLGRFAMPRALAPYAISGMGALLIMIVCAPPLLRRQRRAGNL